MPISILDVSYWQKPEDIPYESLSTLNFQMLIAKISMGGGYDGRADAHLNNARNAGWHIAGYHWIDPTQSWARQAQYAIDKINKHNLICINYDVEQWWADWDKYWKYLDGKISSSEVPRITASRWIDCFCTISEKIIRETNVPMKRHQVYWAKWVSNLYPDLIHYIKNFNQWLADYRYSRRYVKSNFNSDFRVGAEQYRELVNYLYKLNPLCPEGIDSWNMWQFDSKLRLPGAVWNLDTSIFNGTKEAFNAWLDIHSNSNPVPESSPDWLPRLANVEEQIKSIVSWAKDINFKAEG